MHWSDWVITFAALVAILDYFGIRFKEPGWGFPLPANRKWKLAVMLSLVALSLAMSGYRLYALRPAPQTQIPEFDDPDTTLVTGWGQDTPTSCFMDVNGAQLQFRSSGYKLAIGCFAYDGKEDILDAPYVQVSNLYDIKSGPVHVRASYQQYFIEYSSRLNSIGIEVALLNVPNGVQPNQFTTLRQARALGVKIPKINLAKAYRSTR